MELSELQCEVCGLEDLKACICTDIDQRLWDFTECAKQIRKNGKPNTHDERFERLIKVCKFVKKEPDVAQMKVSPVEGFREKLLGPVEEVKPNARRASTGKPKPAASAKTGRRTKASRRS